MSAAAGGDEPSALGPIRELESQLEPGERDAMEVRVSDTHTGGGTLSVVTPKTTYEVRSKDGGALHRWQRKLHELFPQLGVSVRKEGWLQKRGEGGAAKFTKRWCVLDSNYKLRYYKDRASAEALQEHMCVFFFFWFPVPRLLR